MSLPALNFGMATVLAILAPTSTAFGQSTKQLPLFDGALILTTDAGIRQDVRESDGALLDFWRPVTFDPSTRPIGGRMDCKLGGVREDYSEALFDIRQRYKDERAARRKGGLEDGHESYSESGNIRRLEVTGRAADPDRGYVLTYLAMRTDDELYDLRLNCEFRYLQDPGSQTDYAPIMHAHVDIGVPAASPLATPQTPDTDS